jgi:4-amino-4-deoxy-L-arabinose transferase-like glycosyltransferase
MSAVAAAERRAAPLEAPGQSRARLWQRAAFWTILVFAAVIRLWGLGSQPILYFDSGVYLGEGAFLASVAQHAAEAVFSQQSGSVLERVAQAAGTGADGHSPDIAKPGHAILLAIAFLLLGKTALAGALVSALAGIGTVAVTYAIGARGWNPRVGLAASALLAISGQHLVYSREPLVEADGLFFAMLASLIYLQARGNRGLFAAGVLWGLAFSCNNRMSYLPAIFVIAELAQWPGWFGLLRRGLVVAAGCLAPLALIELVYLAARGVGRVTAARTDWLDYAQQLVAFTRMNPPDRIRFDEWPTYFVDVALMDGPVLLVLLLAGIGVVLWRVRSPARTRADLLLASSLLVPLLLYSVYSTGEVRLRHFSLAIPWVMLAAALALDTGASWFARLWRSRGAISEVHAGIVAAAVIVLVLLAMPRIISLDAAPSGMPAVVGSLGSGQVASTNGPVFSFYVGENRTNARLREAFVNVPGDLDVLAADFPTLVVDMQASVFAGDLTDIYARASPRLEVANGSDAWYLADLLEHYGVTWGGWGDLLARWEANRADATQLRVYAMSDVLAARNSR